MKKQLIKMLLILSVFGFILPAFAERGPGYLYTAYGSLVRDAYGHCVHTAYFDPSEGLAECDEKPGENNDDSSS
ncbi:MAG: hypothetical protein QG673_1849 [Pseudomonadota bacterium]|nr:hypothetical protein [Pseudomonadota bacterium]